MHFLFLFLFHLPFLFHHINKLARDPAGGVFFWAHFALFCFFVVLQFGARITEEEEEKHFLGNGFALSGNIQQLVQKDIHTSPTVRLLSFLSIAIIFHNTAWQMRIKKIETKEKTHP